MHQHRIKCEIRFACAQRKQCVAVKRCVYRANGSGEAVVTDLRQPGGLQRAQPGICGDHAYGGVLTGGQQGTGHALQMRLMDIDQLAAVGIFSGACDHASAVFVNHVTKRISGYERTYRPAVYPPSCGALADRASEWESEYLAHGGTGARA